MNCTDTQKVLDNYLDGDLITKDKQAIEAHLQQCTACQQELDDAKVTRRMLSDLPVELPADDFEERVLRKVYKHYAQKEAAVKRDNKFMAGFSTAVAAGLVIWVANIIFIAPDNSTSGNMTANNTTADKTIDTQVITVAMNQVQTIRLMLGSQNNVEQVTLSLGLPDNIRLKGYESRKKLVWKTRLTKGENILSLPVKAIANGQGNLIAQVQYGNKTKRFRILVKTLKDVNHGDVFNNQAKRPNFV